VANGSDGLRVYNVSTPGAPVSVSQTNVPHGSAQGIFLSGNYAFVADAANGLLAYDVSNPANPVNVGNSGETNGGTGNSVVVAGSFAYLANGSDGLRIYSFGVSSTVASPFLTIGPGGGNNVLLTWPAPSTGFVLQQKTNISSTNWAVVTTVPTMTGGSNRVTLPTASNRMFFRLAQTQSPPLAIVGSNSAATLIWSTAFAGYTLQQSASVGSPAWTTVTNTPVTVNGQYQVTLTPANGVRFFRLQQ